MGPQVGADLAALVALDGVVADGAGGLQGVGDLLLGERLEDRVGALVGVVSPDACVAVGLQLDLHGVGIGAGLVVVGAAEGALELLDVVRELVCHDVLLGQRPTAAAHALELVEEGDVVVGVLVGGAVERAGRRRRVAAAGLRGSGENLDAGRLVLDAGLGGQLFGAHAVDGDAGEFDAAVEVFVGVRAGLAVLESALGVLRLIAARLGGLLQLRGIAAEEEEKADEEQAAEAAADGNAAAAATTAAASSVAALLEIGTERHEPSMPAATPTRATKARRLSGTFRGLLWTFRGFTTARPPDSSGAAGRLPSTRARTGARSRLTLTGKALEGPQ